MSRIFYLKASSDENRATLSRTVGIQNADLPGIHTVYIIEFILKCTQSETWILELFKLMQKRSQNISKCVRASRLGGKISL